MNWVNHWRALSDRSEMLFAAARFLAETLKINDTSSNEIEHLLSELKSFRGDLAEFRSTWQSSLPSGAASSLDAYLALLVSGRNVGNPSMALRQFSDMQVFTARFEYFIRDNEIEARNLTDLAFEHLRRLIVVDPEIRKKWTASYKKGEVACEKLGAVHLLSHGIWAFKIVGAAAATDLVYREPIAKSGEILRRTAKALVLTEWKVVKDIKQTEKKAEEARKQTVQYAAGVLGDLELNQTRFVILVGEKSNEAPQDLFDNGITYRHIWIPIKPATPSEVSRSTPKRKTATKSIRKTSA